MRMVAKRARTAPARVRIIKEAANPWYEITLTEGKNRQLRKMFEEIGHHVEKIRRVRYGPLTLDVPPGKSRRLTEREVRQLKKSVERQIPRTKGPAQVAPSRAGSPRS